MTDKEIKEVRKALRKQKLQIRNSKEAALKMLQDIGVLNSKGDYTRPYKALG
jgi:hypothetical protein